MMETIGGKVFENPGETVLRWEVLLGSRVTAQLLGGGGASRPPGLGSEPKLAVTPLGWGAQESGFLTSSQGIPEHI